MMHSLSGVPFLGIYPPEALTVVGKCLSPEMSLAVFIITGSVKQVECLTVSAGYVNRGAATWQDRVR